MVFLPRWLTRCRLGIAAVETDWRSKASLYVRTRGKTVTAEERERVLMVAPRTGTLSWRPVSLPMPTRFFCQAAGVFVNPAKYFPK